MKRNKMRQDTRELSFENIQKQATSLTVKGMGQHLVEELKRTRRQDPRKIDQAINHISIKMGEFLVQLKKSMVSKFGRTTVRQIDFKAIYSLFRMDLLTTKPRPKPISSNAPLSAVSPTIFNDLEEFHEDIIDVRARSNEDGESIETNPTQLIVPPKSSRRNSHRHTKEYEKMLEQRAEIEIDDQLIGEPTRAVNVKYTKKDITKMLKNQKSGLAIAKLLKFENCQGINAPKKIRSVKYR